MSLPAPHEISQQLVTASTAWTKLRRVSAYAAFDGWSLTVFGALTLVCGGYSSVPSLVIGIALLGCGLFELRCVTRLRRLMPTAINQMAVNQLVLAGVLIGYAVVGLIQSRSGVTPGGSSSELEQAFAQTGASTDELQTQLSAVTGIFYLCVMAVAVLVQGSTAIYYRSRRANLQKYLEETPPWIQQMQRERGTISL